MVFENTTFKQNLNISPTYKKKFFLDFVIKKKTTISTYCLVWKFLGMQEMIKLMKS